MLTGILYILSSFSLISTCINAVV